MNVDGSSQIKLTNSDWPASDISPAWSPDGQKIAFSSNRDGDYNQIYVMNADGTGQTRISDGLSNDRTPDWSPDGTKIVFVAGYRYTGQASRIYVMNVDGSGLTELSNTPFESGAPAWSPDGQKIAYQYNDGSVELWVMNADGSGKTRLTYVSPSPPYGMALYPSWSPDGQHIVFSRQITVHPYGKHEIYIMNADGSGHIALTNNPADASNITEHNPDWGP
jgi:Tol biopolymer transport system component